MTATALPASAKYGIELSDWETAHIAADEMIAQAQGDKNIAIAHYTLGALLYMEGVQKHKEELFAAAHEELTKALAAAPNFPDAIFSDGQALAHLKRDDEARARFADFAKRQPEGDPSRQRPLRYVDQPELTRARMAPAFAVVTAEGKRISLNDLKGRASSSISGQPGAVPAAGRCLTSATSSRSSMTNRWLF